MKTKQELDAIREECKNVRKKLLELTDDELSEIAGGLRYDSSHDKKWLIECIKSIIEQSTKEIEIINQ